MADLLTLPDELEGLPVRVRERAFDRAESMLPASLATTLGQERAEQVLVSAAAHVLYMSREGTREGPRPTVAGDPWGGSPYGAEVKQALSLMGKPTGRTRAMPVTSGEAS